MKSESFGDSVPKDLQCKVGYRTDSTDTKVADALLDIAEERNSWEFRASVRDIRDRAGLGSPSTASKGLKRLERWFVEIVEPSDGKTSTKYRINADIAARSYTITRVASVIVYDLNTTYCQHKGDDPFLLGLSRTARRDNLCRRSLGETLLRVIDTLEQHGVLNRKELEACTGKTHSAIATATRSRV